MEYSIVYRGGRYLLKNHGVVISSSCGFYTLCKFCKDNNILFSNISLPRMSLYRFFRDFAYFEEFEKKEGRI